MNKWSFCLLNKPQGSREGGCALAIPQNWHPRSANKSSFSNSALWAGLRCRADAALEDARLELAMEEKRLAECENARRQELDRNLQMRQVGLELAAQIEDRQRVKQEERAEKYAIEKEQVNAVENFRSGI